MLKMKSALCIVAIFSLALVSCVVRLPEADMPNDKNGAVTMVKAVVKPLTLKGLTGAGHYEWKTALTVENSEDLKSIGINGSSKGVNECYLPVQSTIGSNEAYFYGKEVAGDLTIYMPYSEDGGIRADEGRVVVPAEQNYYADPFAHLMYNSTLLGVTSSDVVEFDFHTGLVKVLVEYDVQDIVSVNLLVGNVNANYDNGTPEDTSDDYPYSGYVAGELTTYDGLIDTKYNPSVKVSVNGFGEGVNSTIEKPLVVWAAVAPGFYENFVVEITNKENVTISAPVKGPFLVERCAVASQDCVAKKVDHKNGVDDMTPEDGSFNE